MAIFTAVSLAAAVVSLFLKKLSPESDIKVEVDKSKEYKQVDKQEIDILK